MDNLITARGASIPALGFGTFRIDEANTARMVKEVLGLGYRHIDTAQIYGNEAAVGAGLAAAGVPRQDVFLTTKVWVETYRTDRFRPSVEDSLRRLGTDHVDLLLLHWPNQAVPLEEQIENLNAVRKAGLARHIGISNFNTALMEEAVRLSPAPLVTNQVEYHPYLSQRPVLETARKLGMSVTAYYGMADGEVPADTLLADIGARHDKSAAQVTLRWLVQQSGLIALSKTVSVARAAENAAIFDFSLTEAEMTAIHALARQDGRLVSPDGLAPEWDAAA